MSSLEIINFYPGKNLSAYSVSYIAYRMPLALKILQNKCYLGLYTRHIIIILIIIMIIVIIIIIIIIIIISIIIIIIIITTIIIIIINETDARADQSAEMG